MQIENNNSVFDFALLEPVLSAEAMRAADRFTIDTLGVSGSTLMEVAGRAAAEEAARLAGPSPRHIVVACGKGNNGGDGLVVARRLIVLGYEVAVITTGKLDDFSPDARLNFGLLNHLQHHGYGEQLSVREYTDSTSLSGLEQGDLYIDALLGTGLTSELRGGIREIVDWLNTRRAPVLAVDVPTGLNSDTGEVLGACVRAAATVTMGAIKVGLLLNDGPAHAGQVSVVEIGIPRDVLLRGTTSPSCALGTTDGMVRSCLPTREMHAHKYSVGLALVLGGSPGLTGAPVMASRAAARIGAGAVVCATHESVLPTVSSRVTEVMTLGLPGAADNGIDGERAFDALKPRLKQARALLVGCGLGSAESTASFVRRICAVTDVPVVLDADGLRAFEGRKGELAKGSKGRWILTPHAGEFERLSGEKPGVSRIETARRWAREWDSVLILKGLPSIVATPGGTACVCRTGNPALATAGTGDVLAGFAAGLLVQGLTPEQAAVCAVHIGGACADRWIEIFSGRTMQATDLLMMLPAVLKARFE